MITLAIQTSSKAITLSKNNCTSKTIVTVIPPRFSFLLFFTDLDTYHWSIFTICRWKPHKGVEIF